MSAHLSLSLRLGAVLSLVLMSAGVEVHAQRPASQRITTELQFDILYPSNDRHDAVVAQRWTEVFSKFDVPVRIRRSVLNDQVGTDQHVYGTIRRVKVTGQLDRRGNINFVDRKFSIDDTAQLADWIENLKVYGEQGAPDGKPLWGLERNEFDRLHAMLKQTVPQETLGLTLTEAIRSYELSSSYPLRFSEETRALLTQKSDSLPKYEQNTQGMAKGTALAILLQRYGLGFYPKRLPDESIVLHVEPLKADVNFWPIGWNPDDLGMKRLSISAKLYQPVRISIEQTLMSDLLPRIETETETKVFVDERTLEEMNIHFEKLVINYPTRHTAWTICLRTILAKMKLSHEVRVDENDRLFLWITKFEPRIGESKPSRIRNP